MSFAAAVIVSLIVLLGYKDRSDAVCTPEGIASCTLTSPVAFNSSSIDRDCGRKNDLTNCVSNLGCQPTDDIYKQSFQGTLDSLTYLCGDGKAAWIATRDCVTAQLNSSNTTMTLCNHQYNQSLVGSRDPSARYCRATNEYVSCVRNALTTTCNTQAGNTYAVYIQKLLSPVLLNGYNCTLHDPTVSWTTASTTRHHLKQPKLAGSKFSPSQAILICAALVVSIAAFWQSGHVH